MDDTDQPEMTPQPQPDQAHTSAADAVDTQSNRNRPLTHHPRQSAPNAPRWQRGTPFAQIVALLAVAAIVVGLVAVVRSAHSPTASGTSTSAGAHNSVPTASNAVHLAPDFTLPTLSGAPFHLAGQRGHVVVLYFMSTTCAACVQGSYFVAVAMREAHVPGAQAIAIDMNPGDTAADVRAFAHSAGIPANAPVQWAVDTQLSVSGHYGILVLGTAYVVDGQGRIVYERDGSVAVGPLVQAMQSHA
jgi:peroxiredoxin